MKWKNEKVWDILFQNCVMQLVFEHLFLKPNIKKNVQNIEKVKFWFWNIVWHKVCFYIFSSESNDKNKIIIIFVNGKFFWN